MVNRVQVTRDLKDTDYSDFEFDTVETAVPGLSGSWLVGEIGREGRLKRENLSYPRDSRFASAELPEEILRDCGE